MKDGFPPEREYGATPAGPDWLEMIEHTADTGMVVHAPDLKLLYARAAWGMFAIITDPSAVRTRMTEDIRVEGSDREDLLLRWLSELNFRHVTRRQVYGEFKVLELEDRRLAAVAGGEPVDPARHNIFTEIKAVTFHGLEIVASAEGWRARVIFDL